MPRLILPAVVLVLAAAGCGGSPTMDTAPLSAEQQEKIKQADQQVEEEESHGRGTGFKGKKRK